MALKSCPVSWDVRRVAQRQAQYQGGRRTPIPRLLSNLDQMCPECGILMWVFSEFETRWATHFQNDSTLHGLHAALPGMAAIQPSRRWDGPASCSLTLSQCWLGGSMFCFYQRTGNGMLMVIISWRGVETGDETRWIVPGWNLQEARFLKEYRQQERVESDSVAPGGCAELVMAVVWAVWGCKVQKTPGFSMVDESNCSPWLSCCWWASQKTQHADN